MDKDIERVIRGIFAAYRLIKRLKKSREPKFWEPVPPLTERFSRKD